MVTLTLQSVDLDAQGMVIEFGQIKKLWREWLDDSLDHAVMLHAEDPMIAAIRSIEPEARIFELPGDPTTEHLAAFKHFSGFSKKFSR